MSLRLPRFKRELAKHAKSLPSGTYWRYSNGILPPPFGLLLLQNPELALALAEDAADLAARKHAGGSGDDTTEGG